MAIKGSIRQQNNIKASVHGKKEVVAQTVKVNAGNISLNDLADVSTLNTSDGAVLQYNGTNSRFESTTVVENENLVIGGGAF